MPAPTAALLRATSLERLNAAKAIQAKADEENRPITPEEEERINAFLQEVDQLQLDAERRDKIEAREERLAQPLPRKVRDSKETIEASGGVPTVPAEVRDKEKEKRHGFANLGEFALATRDAVRPTGFRDKRLDFYGAITGAGQRTGSDGGFLVPPQFNTEIWNGVAMEPNSLLTLCDQYPVDGESLTLNANAETSRATGSRFGGIQAYWIAEAGQMTGSKPTFRQIKLEPQELSVLVYATDKLLRNASGFGAYITRAATEEINFLVGDGIINGSGVGKPKGIMTSGCLVSIAKEGSQAAATILEANIAKMWARLHVRSRSRAVWLINQDCESQLGLLTMRVYNVVGNEVVAAPTNPIFDRVANTIYGRPVMAIEFCQTLGTQGDIILADLGSYAVGLRSGGVEAATSMHLRFDWNEQVFRFIFAIDGQPWMNSPLTPFKGTNTISPFIVVDTRA
jgi:HK97 family phage major capsid protein